MSIREVKIVVFDIGRVMIELADGWSGACKLAGVTLHAANYPPTKAAEFAELVDIFEVGNISSDEFFAQTAALHENRYTIAELQRIYGNIIQGEFLGIQEFIQELKDDGRRTACLSNTSAFHWPVLTDPARYPGIAMLDAQYASFLLRVRKPDMEIYRQFEELAGVVTEDILFFDDLPKNIDAARAAGWRAVQIMPDTPPVQQMRRAVGLLTV